MPLALVATGRRPIAVHALSVRLAGLVALALKMSMLPTAQETLGYSRLGRSGPALSAAAKALPAEPVSGARCHGTA